MAEFGGPAEITNTNIVAINEDAEKLWNYILAYRKNLGGTLLDSRYERPLKDNVSMDVIPLEEAVTVSEKSSQ